GLLDLGFNYNKVLDDDFQATPIAVRRNCIGYYSVACTTTSAPRWEQRFTQRTNWKVGNFDLGYIWRRTSAIEVEPGSGTFFEPYTKVAAYDYVDLTAAWSVTKNFRLSLSVNNAFDKQPPKVGNTIASTAFNGGETLPASYDTVGRYFSLGATINF
ncbi:MAG: TonB-dependent receptor, partial [Chitinophagaceae bacterium]|nr:TonB-dependent receptor [Rubrivivax sp.]